VTEQSVSAARSTPRRGLARRVGWSVADQALSSLTNFATGVLIASTLAPLHFGAFSVAFAIYLVALNLTRAVASEPFAVRYGDVPDGEWRIGAAAASGTAVVTGVVGAAFCLVGALLASGPLRPALMALAIAMPGLLLQDSWRFLFATGRRGSSAFAVDLTATVILLPLLLLLRDPPDAGLPVLIWGVAGLGAAAMAVALGRVRPDVGRALGYVRSNADLARPFAGEAALGLAAGQTVTFVLGAAVGLEAAGAYRAAQLLLGPVQVLFMGLALIAVPEAVRLIARGRPPNRVAASISATLLLLIGLWTAAVLSVPAELGERVLGENWAPALPIVPPLALAFGGLVTAAGAGIVLRARAQARRSLGARAVDAVSGLIGGTMGAVAGGALGAAWGIAAGAWIGAAAFWFMLIRAPNPGQRGDRAPDMSEGPVAPGG